MTKEELKRLCAKLRREYYDGEYAAGEIERLDKACKEWRYIAERQQDDLRTGKRTCDFSFLGEDWVNIDNTNPNQPK